MINIMDLNKYLFSSKATLKFKRWSKMLFGEGIHMYVYMDGQMDMASRSLHTGGEWACIGVPLTQQKLKRL